MAGWPGRVVCSDRSGPDLAGANAAGTALIVLVVLAIAVTGLVRLGSLEHTISTQWHAFVHVSEPSASSSTDRMEVHLFSGAGNRYDYWRVAWKVWRMHPLVGVGAGNYSEPYYLCRGTIETIGNPHSIGLQLLSELGLVSAALFAPVLACTSTPALRPASSTVSRPSRHVARCLGGADNPRLPRRHCLVSAFMHTPAKPLARRRLAPASVRWRPRARARARWRRRIRSTAAQLLDTRPDDQTLAVCLPTEVPALYSSCLQSGRFGYGHWRP